MAVRREPFCKGPPDPFAYLYAKAFLQSHLQLSNRESKETYKVSIQNITRAAKTRRFYSNERLLKINMNHERAI